MKRSWAKSLLVVPLAALLIGLALSQPVAARTQRCPTECGIKVEQGPWCYSGDKVIVALCIKAGTQTFPFYGDGTNGCYTVTGLGTKNVTVTGGGTSRTCKDISHVVFYWDCKGGDGGGIG